MHVLPRVVNAELLQSKLNLDFIKFTNDLFCVTSVLKSPHNKIGVSVYALRPLKFDCRTDFDLQLAALEAGRGEAREVAVAMSNKRSFLLYPMILTTSVPYDDVMEIFAK
jgi:hypothetical protein